MKIKQITLGQVMTNCFIIEIGEHVVIIDPVLPDFQIDEHIGEKKVCAILLTHGHFDHILGTDYYSQKYNAPVYIHQNDVICLRDGEANLSRLFGVGDKTQTVSPIVLKGAEGEIPEIPVTVSYFHSPGHSRGHVIYYFEKQNVIFTGDLVFNGSIGRYDLPRCSEKDMKNSIQHFFANMLFQQKNPILYPGHGPKTTFVDEQRSNQQVRLLLEER